MKKIDNYEGIPGWGYQDKKLGRGFTGTREQITIQLQNAYVEAGIPFHEKELPALIENWMCEQKLARHCSERIEGLGDLVHMVASPIARAMDKVLGTNFVPCVEREESPCQKRRRKLNKAVPL